jgi:hypothetical protein
MEKIRIRDKLPGSATLIQNAKLFLQRLELGLPHPLNCRRMCSPLWFQGGKHSLAGEGGPNSDELTRSRYPCPYVLCALHLSFIILGKNYLGLMYMMLSNCTIWSNAPCCLVCGCEDPTTAVADGLQIIARHVAMAAAQLREVVAVRVHFCFLHNSSRGWGFIL